MPPKYTILVRRKCPVCNCWATLTGPEYDWVKRDHPQCYTQALHHIAVLLGAPPRGTKEKP